MATIRLRHGAGIPRHSVARKGISIGLLPVLVNLTLFLFGAVAWVFKIGDDARGYLLPVSPTQVGLPIMGVVALFVTVQVWKLHFPTFAICAWSMRIVNLGISLILIGTTVHIAGSSEFRTEAILYFGRWLLPWSALLMIALGMLYRGNKDFVVYGLLFGCVLSVICVEANRRGFPIPIGRMGESRYAGLLNHANDYGILTSSTAPLIVYVLHKRGWWARVLACACLPAFTVALFQSLSKTNMILFPIVLAVTLLAYSLDDFRKMARATVLIAAMAFVASSLFALVLRILEVSDPKQFQILTQLATDPSSIASLDERQDAWDEVTTYIHQHPWFGMGPGWGRDHLLYTHAHNMFLQAWIDVGIVGLIGASLLALGILVRNGEVLWAVFTRKRPINEETRLQMACGVALLTAVLGNSLSSSLQTTTIQSFAMLLALSFVSPAIRPFLGPAVARVVHPRVNGPSALKVFAAHSSPPHIQASGPGMGAKVQSIANRAKGRIQ